MRALLFAISAMVSLAFAELALRLLGTAGPPDSEGPRDGGFSFFRFDPQLGWDLVPGAVDRHTTPEFDVTIAITEQGLREGRVYGATPGPGTVRWLVVGDSFTFGHGVDEAESWSSVLESASAGSLEVVNLAVTGFGLDQQVLKLEGELPRWPHSSGVLVGLFEGDVFRTARTVHYGYAKPWFEVREGRLVLRGVPVPREAPEVPLGRLALTQLARTRGRELVEHLGFGSAWNRSVALFERLADLGESEGLDVRIVLIPKDRAVEGAGWRRALHERTLAEIRRRVASAGLPLIDTTAALREATARGERLYYPADGHWTPAAHAVAAGAVAAGLDDA